MMIKPIKIVYVKPYEIVCEFNTGDVRKIDMNPVLKHSVADVDIQKLLKPGFFITVKLGALGQLYWKNAAKMKDEKGNYFTCEYDVSPEFFYFHSVKV